MFRQLSIESKRIELRNSSFAALEAALAAPLVLCLTFGLIDGTRMIMAQSVAEFTAQQMVRWGQSHAAASTSEFMDYAKAELTEASELAKTMTVSVFPIGKGGKIQVRSTFAFWSPKFIRGFIPGSSGAKYIILYASAPF
jgi:Flp pilus assembly protein TadG